MGVEHERPFVRLSPSQPEGPPGRPGWLPTQAPHRSVLAPLTHTAPHLMPSLPWRSVVVTLTRSPASMDRPCGPPTVPETLCPSLPRVPRVGSPGSSVLWDAPTPCRPSRRTSLPSFGDPIVSSRVRPRRPRTWAADHPGVGQPGLPPAIPMETAGSLRFPSDPRVPAPCSGTPVGPKHARPLRRVGAAPACVNNGGSRNEKISGLDRTALGLAVYASQWKSPSPTQDLLPAAGQALPGGIRSPAGLP